MTSFWFEDPSLAKPIKEDAGPNVDPRLWPRECREMVSGEREGGEGRIWRSSVPGPPPATTHRQPGPPPLQFLTYNEGLCTRSSNQLLFPPAPARLPQGLSYNVGLYSSYQLIPPPFFFFRASPTRARSASSSAGPLMTGRRDPLSRGVNLPPHKLTGMLITPTSIPHIPPTHVYHTCTAGWALSPS